MCIKGALPADIPRPWPALVSAPCTELFSTAEIQPCCFLLQLPPSSKARSWSPEAREGSSGLCAQEMLKCSLISVGSPLSESVSCCGSGPVLSLVLLQPPTPWLCWRLPCRGMESRHSFMIPALEEGICYSFWRALVAWDV